MNTTNDRWDVKLEDAPLKKSGVPGWVWGCGGGCMLTLLLVIGATWWFGSKLVKGFGPEAAWPQVAEIMPYGPPAPDGGTVDHTVGRPPGIVPGIFSVDNPMIGWMMDEQDLEKISFQSAIILQPEPTASKAVGDGINATLIVFRKKLDGDPVQFVIDSPFLADLRQAEVAEKSLGAVEALLQGRSVKTHHMVVDPGEGQENPLMPNSTGAEGMLFVDISGDRERSIVLLCTSTGAATADMASLEVFLAPFRVWEGK